MSLPVDLENNTGQPSPEFELGLGSVEGFHEPSKYRPDAALVDAIKVALLLRKPLLVTGEPGTGKTDLGKYLAWKMGYSLYKFDAKSNSVARDLFYTYDSLGRFQARQGGDDSNLKNFFRFEALGSAILNTHSQDVIPEKVRDLFPTNYQHLGPRMSVVVVDEIDKAPRDFPNDLLNEIDERFFFRIPEVGIAPIEANAKLKPILVITSNSEKNLPAPFVRRCVYFNIEFPRDKKEIQGRIQEIVAGRINGLSTNSALLQDAIGFFTELRLDSLNLTRKPATAELLDWLAAMLAMNANQSKDLLSQRSLTESTLPALIKQAEDRVIAIQTLRARTSNPKT